MINQPKNTQKVTQIIIIHAWGRIVGKLALFWKKENTVISWFWRGIRFAKTEFGNWPPYGGEILPHSDSSPPNWSCATWKPWKNGFDLLLQCFHIGGCLSWKFPRLSWKSQLVPACHGSFPASSPIVPSAGLNFWQAAPHFPSIFFVHGWENNIQIELIFFIISASKSVCWSVWLSDSHSLSLCLSVCLPVSVCLSFSL